MITPEVRRQAFLVMALCVLLTGLSRSARAGPFEKRDQEQTTALPELGLEVKLPSGAELEWPVRAVQKPLDTLIPGFTVRRYISINKFEPQPFDPARLPRYTIDFWQLIEPAEAEFDAVMRQFDVLRAKVDGPGIATEPPFERDIGRFKLGIFRVHSFVSTNGREYSDTTEFVVFAPQKRVNNEVVGVGPVWAVAMILYEATDKDVIQEIETFLFDMRVHKRPVD